MLHWLKKHADFAELYLLITAFYSDVNVCVYATMFICVYTAHTHTHTHIHTHTRPFFAGLCLQHPEGTFCCLDLWFRLPVSVCVCVCVCVFEPTSAGWNLTSFIHTYESCLYIPPLKIFMHSYAYCISQLGMNESWHTHIRTLNICMFVTECVYVCHDWICVCMWLNVS